MKHLFDVKKLLLQRTTDIIRSEGFLPSSNEVPRVELILFLGMVLICGILLYFLTL